MHWIIIIALWMAVHPTIKPNKSTSVAKQEAQTQVHPSAITFINNKTCSPDQQHGSNDSPNWHASPEWWLVILGFPTLFFLVYQAKQAANATKAMRDSLPLQKNAADAALLNAQALINAERPWVTVKVIRVIGKVKGTPYFQFHIFNVGKSAARILSCVGPIEADYKFPQSELPVPPDYGENALWGERVLAPGDSFQIGIINMFHTVTTSRREARCTRQGISVKDAQFVVYGRIEYSDGVSQCTHETRYCYNHVDDSGSPWGANDPVGGEMILFGPREYNGYS